MGKRRRQSTQRCFTALSYLSGVEVQETLHTLNTKAGKRVHKDPDLSPGVNCCAVCAGQANSNAVTVLCPKCRRVCYCCVQHMDQDKSTHEKCCDALLAATVIEADVPAERVVSILCHALTSLQDRTIGSSWADALHCCAEHANSVGSNAAASRSRSQTCCVHAY